MYIKIKFVLFCVTLLSTALLTQETTCSYSSTFRETPLRAYFNFLFCICWTTWVRVLTIWNSLFFEVEDSQHFSQQLTTFPYPGQDYPVYALRLNINSIFKFTSISPKWSPIFKVNYVSCMFYHPSVGIRTWYFYLHRYLFWYTRCLNFVT